MEIQNLQVKGMHCVSCSQIISRSLKKLNGVNSAEINFATEKASISFDPNVISVLQMNKEIGKLGYNLIVDQTEKQEITQESDNVDQLNKVYFSLPLTLFVFILMIWDIAQRSLNFIPNMPIPMSLLNNILFILSSIFLFWVGKSYLASIIRFIQFKVANMDTLVGIGTLTAYLYSSILVLFPNIKDLFNLPNHTYFDVTIVVIGFITLGKYLEGRSKVKTGDSIKKLLNLQTKTALIKRDGKELIIPISEVLVGDILIVKQGQKIPVDGVITDGSPLIDESMISGEPLPKDKSIGDFVIGSTINKKGVFEFKAMKVGSDTMLSQIVAMVENAQGSKAKIQNLADKISSIFVPAVLLIALISLIAWLTIGTFFLGFTTAFSFALISFVGILVIACPCALGLATPTAIIVGVGRGAENGILIKNAQSLENLQKVNTLVFDKTGTITNGKPEVTGIVSLNKNYAKGLIMEYALSLEKNSQHPLADSIVKKAKAMKVKDYKITNFKETEGIGVSAEISGTKVVISKPSGKDLEIQELIDLLNQGKTVVVLKVNGSSVGLISISDTIKENAKSVIQNLHKLKIQTIMLTGDNKKSAKNIADQLGISEVKAEVMPQDKAEVIKSLQQAGRVVAMVGDGINDAPALVQANVGIAMATGTDIAIESSDVTLLGGDISKIPQAIKLSKATMRTIKQNLFWAFIYNIIGIPLASGLLYPLLGVFLNPVFAGGAMAMSSVSVVTNSLLLKRVNITKV